MPQRREPINSEGSEECSEAVKSRELSTLLREAQPTWSEIDGEPNKLKRKERERSRDIATKTLITIKNTGKFRGEKLGTLDRLRVSSFIKELMDRNGGRLPTSRGVKPQESPVRLQHAVAILKAIETNSEKPKREQEKVSSVLKTVAHNSGKQLSYIKEIYYDLRLPKWRGTVKAEWREAVKAERAEERAFSKAVKAERAFSKENAEMGQICAKRDAKRIAKLADLRFSEYEQLRQAEAKKLNMTPAALDNARTQAQRNRRRAS
jgi:hypothetical protein